jgi:L,D-transpeptidase YbiS
MIGIKVHIQTQKLLVYEDKVCTKEYLIYTAEKGVGELNGSNQTPRGWHEIRAKIGAGCPVNTIFVERRPTGEIFSSELRITFPGRDWILTRILWLRGLEIGRNRLGNVDTMQRYIYIHGAPDDMPMGKPHSKGCICMRHENIIELFDRVPVGARVLIEDN